MKEAIRENLLRDVRVLAGEIGVRSYLDTKSLDRAADYIAGRLSGAGLRLREQRFSYRGSEYRNLVAESEGSAASEEAIVVGAHYDTVLGCPGADDNASGVAGLLEIARLARALGPTRLPLRLVAFSLEEPPVFRRHDMGSYVYAKSLRDEGLRLRGMISLEMIGFYRDGRGSQYYPFPGFKWIYPDTGNFIAFVGNIASKGFTKEVRDRYRAYSKVPVESLNTVSAVPGVDFSDQRSFWKMGYDAFMVTDTAFYRNPHYHSPADLPETLDYERMAEVVYGLYNALCDLK